MIGAVVLTSAILVVLIVLLLFSGISQNHFTTEYQQTIDYQLGKARQASAITAALNDKLWRAETTGNEVADYDGRTAYKVLSYYFSTKGGDSATIYIDGNQYTKQQVRKDLEQYFSNRFNLIWKNRRQPVAYRLRVVDPENPRSKPLSVGTYRPTPSSLRTSFPVTLVNGETARFVLWTENAKSVNVIQQ